MLAAALSRPLKPQTHTTKIATSNFTAQHDDAIALWCVARRALSELTDRRQNGNPEIEVFHREGEREETFTVNSSQ